MPSTLPLAVLYHGIPWQAVALAEGPPHPADALRRLTHPGAHPLLLTAQAPPPVTATTSPFRARSSGTSEESS